MLDEYFYQIYNHRVRQLSRRDAIASRPGLQPHYVTAVRYELPHYVHMDVHLSLSYQNSRPSDITSLAEHAEFQSREHAKRASNARRPTQTYQRSVYQKHSKWELEE